MINRGIKTSETRDETVDLTTSQIDQKKNKAVYKNVYVGLVYILKLTG